MIIDAHFHLDEQLLTVPQMLTKMDDAGIDRTALMAALVDPFPEPPAFIASAGQYILKHRPLRRLGKKLAANFTAKGIDILGIDYALYPDPDNGPVFELAEQYPDRFNAWAFVNPRGLKNPVTEAKEWLDHPACVGIKAHPFWHRYRPLELMETAALAASKNKPLIIHAGFDEEGDYLPLIHEIPGLKLILAHCGFPEYADTWYKILKNKNIFIDISQTSYVSSRTIKEALALLGPERCIFGTDGPFGIHGKDDLFDYREIKKRIETLVPDEGTRRRILGENFAELAGIQL